MLIRRATLLDGTVTDIRVGEQIDEVGDNLDVRPGEGLLDAGRGTVLPGLHDHHVHIRSAASAL
jgi:dihydroorotase-like cyclic amidohydrolase